MESVNALRDSVEKYGAESAETKQRSEKIEKSLDAFEDYKQKELAKSNEQETKMKEMEERHKVLELEVAKSGVHKGLNYRESEEYKCLQTFAKTGEFLPETKTMRMDDNTAGGALTSTELDNQIIKKITEISPVRNIVTVRTVSKKTLEMPTRTSIPTATYEGEAASASASQSAYGTETLTAYRLTVNVPYTEDLLGDADFDLINEINSDVAEAFAFTEGNKFVLGTGVKEPEGFTINSTVVAAARTSTTSGVIK
jgi:HK97 family phage major capsid protein